MTAPLIVREDDGSLWLSITEAQADALNAGQTMLLQKPYYPPPGAIILTTEQWNEWSRNGASRISGVYVPWEPEPDQSANLQTEALRHGRDRDGICTECGVPASTMHVDSCSFAGSDRIFKPVTMKPRILAIKKRDGTIEEVDETMNPQTCGVNDDAPADNESYAARMVAQELDLPHGIIASETVTLNSLSRDIAAIHDQPASKPARDPRLGITGEVEGGAYCVPPRLKYTPEPACTCPSSVIARGEHESACAWKAAQ